MPVKVTFPDGTKREVPSTLRLIERKVVTNSVSQPPAVRVEEPSYNPDWEFRGHLNGWTAHPRK